MAAPTHWVVQYCSSVKPYVGAFTWSDCLHWITIGEKFKTKEEAEAFKDGEATHRRHSPVGTALRVYPIYPSVTLSKYGSSNPTVFVEVRFLKETPAIIGSDFNTYGPFKKGDVAAIPKENASVLIKMGVAEKRFGLPKKPTLKEVMKGEVLTGYIERARVKPLIPERLGYRVGEPQETNAKKLIEFEVVELGNEHLLDDAGKALNAEPNLPAIKKAIDERFGPDAIGMWLCDKREWAEKEYGPGEAHEVEIPANAIVVSDLGVDGKLWIWRGEEPRLKGEEKKIEEVRKKVEKVLKEVQEARGE